MQKTGLKRQVIDKFYTHPDVVQLCVDAFQENISITEQDICIEPSAGNGAFLPFIQSTFREYFLYDIAPEHPDIRPQDFLTLDTSIFSSKRVHVLGNPPFGRQSATAIQFIKKCASFADTIAFILPKSFMKEIMQRCIPSYFHLQRQIELHSNAFLVDGKTHDVPCVFQIWVKKQEKREGIQKLIPSGYTFVKKEEHPDFSIRRVGVNCGCVDTNTQDKSIHSHYFIRCEHPLTDELFTKLSTVEFPTKTFTVGPRSISKQDIIQQFNPLFISKK